MTAWISLCGVNNLLRALQGKGGRNAERGFLTGAAVCRRDTDAAR